MARSGSPALLRMEGVSKSFGRTRALAEASFSVSRGEIHALLGENGAGKTTLVSIAAGRIRPDAGEILFDGTPVPPGDPRSCRRFGIALVPQQDLLLQAASVADNLSLLDGSAPLFESRRARHERVRRLAERFLLDLGDPEGRAADLSVAARQRIEIAGALAADPDLLILDEPTAILSPDETMALFATLRSRADSGRAVVLITHRLAEVFEVADRVTLLARGRTVRQCPVGETTAEEIGGLLVGSAGGEGTTTLGRERRRKRRPDAPKIMPATLEVTDVVPEGPGSVPAPPVSFSLHPCELLVLLAIDGNGADALASAIAGIRLRHGRIRLAGRVLPNRSVRAFRAAGGRFVPADRLAEGLVPGMTLAENLALTRRALPFLLDRSALRKEASDLIARFGIKASSPDSRGDELSGGNQQKLVLTRELATVPTLLVAIHPTRGLDLAASAEVRGRLEETRRQGAAILLVTADPEEARLLTGSIRVVYRGRLSEPLSDDTPVEVLGRRMAGLAT